MRKTCFLLLLFAYQFVFCQELTLKQALKEIKDVPVTSSAIIKIENALKDIDDTTLKIEGAKTLARAYYGIERYEKALEYYYQGLDLATKFNKVEDLGSLNEGLGNLHFRLGNYDKCDSFYKASLHYFKAIKNKDRVNKAKGNLAILDIKKGNYDNALKSLNEMLAESLDAKSKAIVLSNLGNVYLEQRKDLDRAILYYNKAIALLNEEDNTRFMASLYQNIAESYIYKKDFNKALAQLKVSEGLLKKTNDKELSASLYKFYAMVYESLGRYDLGLKYHKLFFEENVKVEESKNTWLIENKEISNQLKNNEIEKEKAEQKIKILKAEKSLATVKVYLLILALLFLILMVYVINKKQKEKISKLNNSVIQTQDKLKYTEDKAEKIILNVNHTQDFVQQFTGQLKDIYTTCTDEVAKKKLQEMVQDVQQSKIPNQKSEELIQTLSSSFVYNLEKNHADLTEEERKITELIFLGYKNKEIAGLLNLSVRSIENCRYRIRKKMNLETTTSLSAYLQSLS